MSPGTLSADYSSPAQDHFPTNYIQSVFYEKHYTFILPTFSSGIGLSGTNKELTGARIRTTVLPSTGSGRLFAIEELLREPPSK